ncbi:ABC transporter ATP-binding protein [Deinococcus cellulosilyticus]|uniref:HlyB/MsbA family ABC transporter n=1 Tax=Deinococcus cellulosilyticus (strain DSM 18568 / NBRC 106333 / KACC 11606 / 5516J-15) TaxID=1223518 RepID=A0A511MZS0_DEIC1|nr:ABC transporter ATP-binding protein [Deinococcus cellulosilyticus]GEM46094.1 HlyB/MsbA family ABC transporter [Deinococcus cellulosilyticus NBRC 106333 = KACC 11606]
MTSSAPKTDFSTQIKDLRETLSLVWETAPAQAFLLVMLSVVQAFLPAATLWVSKLLLDAVTAAISQQQNNLTQLVEILLLQVGIGILGSLLSTWQGMVRELFADSLQNRISQKILNKASELEVERFENAETYDALQNAYREVGSRPLGVLTQVIALGQAVITLASISALMARLGWAILPLVLLATLPTVWVSNRFGMEGYRMIRRRTHDARVQNYLGSILTSDALVKEVRLFHFEPYLLTRWQEYYRKFRAQLVPLVRARSLWSLGASIFSALVIAFATYLILLRAVAGQITVGDFSLFILGITQVQGQFSTLLNGFSGLYQNVIYMRNLFEFLELPARDLDAGESFSGTIDTLEFEQVSFRYPFTDRDILKGVSFRIEKGHALALVGENGAGKTTIVKLLTRLFEPTAGRILINGQDARTFSVRSLQQAMSIIFQDFGQYQMSVRENIALSDHPETQTNASERVEEAAETAGAHFIETLPEQYSTQLGRLFTGGRQLSGGQWQRLALARLYYRKASLLVFDEPTAALDANAEFEVVEALRKEAHSRITVIISHRFSTVRLADHIIVLENGVIEESGSHAELMAQGRTYAHMYTLQAKGYQG